MITLLSEMNRVRKQLIKDGGNAFSGGQITAYEERYRELIGKGREENKKIRHKYARDDEKGY